MIDWFALTFGLLGGLALFLFGMDEMAQGLKSAAGKGLKLLLARLTRNRLAGALTGAFVTAVLNSSSVTTVLVVGFVTAGLMSLSQSISVIMGANVGSTFTAQIIAFNVTRYALAMIAIGFAARFAGRVDWARQLGSMVMGLGLVFFGMAVMSDSMAPLRDYEPFLQLMTRMENPLLGILIGALFTGLVQSSAATTGLAIVMASEGLITLPAGIALAFGANIGTCVTALLAAIGKPVEAVRAAAAHVAFNIAGVLIWVWFIDDLAAIVARISPAYPDLQGTARAAAEVPRQIANANTVFNVANTLFFLPFTGVFARLVTRLVKDRPDPVTEIIRPKYLDEELIATPALALDRVRLELARMGRIVSSMLNGIAAAVEARDPRRVMQVATSDDQVDELQKHILVYMQQIQRSELSESQNREFLQLMFASDLIESTGDVIETNLAAVARRVIDQEIRASRTMALILTGLYTAVSQAFEAAVEAVRDDDAARAEAVIALRSEVNRHLDEALRHQATKLTAEDPKRLLIFRSEMEAVDALKRIYTLSKRMARTVSPKEAAA